MGWRWTCIVNCKEPPDKNCVTHSHTSTRVNHKDTSPWKTHFPKSLFFFCYFVLKGCMWVYAHHRPKIQTLLCSPQKTCKNILWTHKTDVTLHCPTQCMKKEKNPIFIKSTAYKCNNSSRNPHLARAVAG